MLTIAKNSQNFNDLPKKYVKLAISSLCETNINPSVICSHTSFSNNQFNLGLVFGEDMMRSVLDVEVDAGETEDRVHQAEVEFYISLKASEM